MKRFKPLKDNFIDQDIFLFMKRGNTTGNKIPEEKQLIKVNFLVAFIVENLLRISTNTWRLKVMKKSV